MPVYPASNPSRPGEINAPISAFVIRHSKLREYLSVRTDGANVGAKSTRPRALPKYGIEFKHLANFGRRRDNVDIGLT